MKSYKETFSKNERENYINMLQMMGSLSKLFSENEKPYLAYRVTENLFCKFLNADNLSRHDTTADAKKGSIGFCIKTWIDSNWQKIAEFDKLKKEYENDSPKEKIIKIAKYRNERISFAKNTHKLECLIYHCTIRNTNSISINECYLEPIDIQNIKILENDGNSIKFTDGKNDYSFNTSKSTLLMCFNKLKTLQEISVEIIEEPFEFLAEKMKILLKPKEDGETEMKLLDKAVLPLYSTRGKVKYVPPKNNLNMRFASGRPRDPYEIGIPIPADFRAAHKAFFPGLDISFQLILPNGKILSAKQCQQDGKALMSNPNKALGQWLIDDVLKIDKNIVITYEQLLRLGVDSVEILKFENTKTSEVFYKIDFALVGSYEDFMRI